MGIISKKTTKHAKGLYEIKLLVEERREANVILRSLLSSPANKDIGNFLGLSCTHHNTNFGEAGFTFKASHGDIKLAIESCEFFREEDLRTLLLPEEVIYE